MTKRKKRIICGIVILVLAAAWLFYAFPRTPEQMVPGLDFSACDRLTLDATEFPDGKAQNQVNYSLVLTPGDEGFDEILSSLRTRKFSRSPFGWLSKNATKIHRNAAGDIRWSVHCPCGDMMFRLNNFFGSVSMTADPGDRYAKLRPAEKADWLNSVFLLIRDNPDATITIGQ